MRGKAGVAQSVQRLGYRLDRGIVVTFPAGPRDFPLKRSVKTDSDDQLFCHSVGTGSGVEAGQYIQCTSNQKIRFC